MGGEEKTVLGLQTDFPRHPPVLLSRATCAISSSAWRALRLYRWNVSTVRCIPAGNLSCQDAHGLVLRVLKALTIAGGTPQPISRA
jgi:hypothetical protein